MEPFALHELLSYLAPALVMIAIGFPLARAIGHRIMNPRNAAPALPSDVAQRLERIEAAVDAVALEVERISEAQRFALKLGKEPPQLGHGPNS